MERTGRYYSGIVVTPYNTWMGELRRERKELELCRNCNTYQHMRTKKFDGARRFLMCPKCKMVTIKYNNFPRQLMYQYEIDIVDKAGTMEASNVFGDAKVTIELIGNYNMNKILEAVDKLEFATPNLVAAEVDMTYDKVQFWLRKLVRNGVLEKHYVPFEYVKDVKGSIYYCRVEVES